jgi:hypothetical protein
VQLEKLGLFEGRRATTPAMKGSCSQKEPKKRICALVAKINPAQVLPTPGEERVQTQQSASSDEAAPMDVDGEAVGEDPPASPAGDAPPATRQVLGCKFWSRFRSLMGCNQVGTRNAPVDFSST